MAARFVTISLVTKCAVVTKRAVVTKCAVVTKHPSTHYALVFVPTSQCGQVSLIRSKPKNKSKSKQKQHLPLSIRPPPCPKYGAKSILLLFTTKQLKRP